MHLQYTSSRPIWCGHFEFIYCFCRLWIFLFFLYAAYAERRNASHYIGKEDTKIRITQIISMENQLAFRKLCPSIQFQQTSTQRKSSSQLSLSASQENTIWKRNYATGRSTFCLVSERWVCARASKHCQEKFIVLLMHFTIRFLSRIRGVCHTRHVHHKQLEKERNNRCFTVLLSHAKCAHITICSSKSFIKFRFVRSWNSHINCKSTLTQTVKRIRLDIRWQCEF